MREGTKSAAAALLEDLAHIRKELDDPGMTRGTARRLMAQLRRLLIDGDSGDVSAVAAPRIQRITIQAPNNTAFYRSSEQKPFRFFASGGARLFGATPRACMLDMAQMVGDPRPELARLDESFFRPVELRVDSFLNQKVLCLNGRWANRRDVIKYIAIVGHAVHSQGFKDDKDRLIHRMQNAVHFMRGKGGFDIGIRAALYSENYESELNNPYKKINPNNIDCVLAEGLAAARFLCDSPKIKELERFIYAELYE